MPVSIDKTYLLNIEDLTNRAEGVAKVDGFTIFVPRAVPGDTVLARVILEKKNYARALIEKFIKKSLDRAEPFCKYYQECGGCQLQHLNYKTQLKYKRQHVIDAIQRIGNVEDIKVNHVIGMENPKFYRNKSSMPASGTLENFKLGFYRYKSHEVVDIDECPIQEKIINSILLYIRSFLKQKTIESCNEENYADILRHLMFRVAPKTQQVLVVFVVNENTNLFDCLGKKLMKEFKNIKGVLLNVNTKKTNVILGETNVIIEGEDIIFDELLGYKFLISANSFYQINGKQTDRLYSSAISKLNLDGTEVIIDAYCGTGTIGIMLAASAAKVFGIEVNEDAVKDAMINAEINGVENISFIQGKSEEEIPKLISRNIVPDVLVVDPPRSGCDYELIKTIIAEDIKKILYVSCNASTLARDIGYLVTKGYEIIGEVQPVDMFPHTTHVECIAFIQKKMS